MNIAVTTSASYQGLEFISSNGVTSMRIFNISFRLPNNLPTNKLLSYLVQPLHVFNPVNKTSLTEHSNIQAIEVRANYVTLA
jgi:hypothetical protein